MWCNNALGDPSTPSQCLTLVKPSNNQLKCNVDCALFSTERFGVDIGFLGVAHNLARVYVLQSNLDTFLSSSK